MAKIMCPTLVCWRTTGCSHDLLPSLILETSLNLEEKGLKPSLVVAGLLSSHVCFRILARLFVPFMGMLSLRYCVRSKL